MANEFLKDPNKQLLADRLRVLLCIESSKPYQTMDYRLVQEYSELLTELEGHKKLTKSEVKKQAARVVNRCINRKYRSKGKLKTILIAACIAILVLVSGLFALSLREGGLDVIQRFSHRITEMFENKSFSTGNIEVLKSSDSRIYDSIESYLSGNDTAILYPTNLPREAEIVNVTRYSENNVENVSFSISDQTVKFVVYCDHINQDVLNDPALKREVICGFDCYILDLESSVQVWFFDGGNTYLLRAQSINDVYLIIENLKES